jgi:hypothetical protein
MKKSAIILLLVLAAGVGNAQPKKYETIAIQIIDRMAGVIRNLEACSFTLNTAIDITDSAHRLIKCFTDYEVFLGRPGEMIINASGYKGHRLLMYNGHQMAFYSFDEHNYGILQTPNTLIETIDSLHNYYDIEFPAADFFYPQFTKDLLDNSDSLQFVGIAGIEGKEYFHLIAFSKEMIIQFWINNDVYTLPAKFAITYIKKEGSPQYLATFSGWQINPDLPPAMFDFLPPPGASKVRMLSKSEK